MVDKILMTIGLTGFVIALISGSFELFQLERKIEDSEKRIIVLETKLGIDQCHKN